MRDTWIVWSSLLTELPQILFKHRRKCTSSFRLDGKVAIVTGANTGIGKETAYQLSTSGAKVILGCRDLIKTEIAINDIKTRNPSANVYGLRLDLSSLQSVRQFAQTVQTKEDKIDILVNNAGVRVGPEQRTEDGFEMQIGVQHFGHFLLTMHSLPLLKKSSDARVISVSSPSHGWGRIHFDNINLKNGAYSQFAAHYQSKLAQVLFTRELATRLGPKSTVKSYALNPSGVYTHPSENKLTDFFLKMFLLPIEMGPQTIMYCLEEGLAQESGHYYDNCRRVDQMVSQAVDDESARRLWQLSSELVQLEDHLKI